MQVYDVEIKPMELMHASTAGTDMIYRRVTWSEPTLTANGHLADESGKACKWLGIHYQ